MARGQGLTIWLERRAKKGGRYRARPKTIRRKEKLFQEIVNYHVRVKRRKPANRDGLGRRSGNSHNTSWSRARGGRWSLRTDRAKKLLPSANIKAHVSKERTREQGIGNKTERIG